MTTEKLREHIHGGYHTIRRGIGILGFIFPTVLVLGGLIGKFWFEIDELPGSLSSYYNHPMRNVYVGLLCTIGICLHLYKGFTTKEDRFLDAAGILAFFTAIIPSSLEQVPYAWGWLHYTCAVSFFFCIGYVCIRLASESLDEIDALDNEEVKKKIDTEKFRKIYKILGVSMWVLPVALLIRAYIFKDFQYLVLWIEIAAVVTFSYYWIKKSEEMKIVDDIALR